MDNTFRSFFDQMPVMVHSIDGDGRINYVNNNWLSTLGYEAEEVMGRRSVEFLTEASREFATNVVLPLYHKQGHIKEIPYEFVTKGGEIVYVFLSASSIFNDDGEFVRSVAILSNISSLLNLNKVEPQYIANWMVEPDMYNKKLVELRKSKSYSQEKMANILNVSTRTYQRLEQGTSPVSVDYISTLADHFNFSPSLFFIKSSLFNEDNNDSANMTFSQ